MKPAWSFYPCKLTDHCWVGLRHLDGQSSSIPEASPYTAVPVALWVYRAGLGGCLCGPASQAAQGQTHKANLQPSSLGNQIAAPKLYGCPCLISSLPHGLCLKRHRSVNMKPFHNQNSDPLFLQLPNPLAPRLLLPYFCPYHSNVPLMTSTFPLTLLSIV